MSDSRASRHMSHSSNCINNYREFNATVRTVSRKIYPFEGCSDFPLTFRSCIGEMFLLLRDVGHVQNLRYQFNLF